ncbi:MAG: ABC transporter permease, partial [Gemmatimonadetes bacterium]|nr:ABC transporter permease [Gemmatimonadota bacterium]
TPISGMGWNGVVSTEGYAPKSERDALVFFNAVSDGFFATMGTRLLAGRDFAAGDAAGAQRVAVVNQAMARRFFGGASPLGRRIGIEAGPGAEQSLRVVGVVADTKYGSLREETRPLVYLPMSQDPEGGPAFNLEVRGHGPPAALAPTVTAVVGGVNRGISLGYTTLSEQVDASLTRERLLAALSGFFGGLALLLATVGLYGTMAYTVARRRGEIGIRIALGAARTRVMRLVMGEVGRLVAAGVALGALGAWVAARWMTPFLFGLAPSDPATWILSAATLAGAAGVAGALPAWSAAKVDPMASLREE